MYTFAWKNISNQNVYLKDNIVFLTILFLPIQTLLFTKENLNILAFLNNNKKKGIIGYWDMYFCKYKIYRTI